LETEDDRRPSPRLKLFFDEITGTDIKNPKTVLGSSLGDNFCFRNMRIIIIFSDIQRYVSNDQAHGKLSGNKD
jgi:hypothetical protein